MDLNEFLLARIAEDEAVAQDIYVDPGKWRADGLIGLDPSRMLAECEAKRRIVAEHPHRQWDGWTYCETCNMTEGGTIYDVEKAGNCPTLRLLALPYADHPAWREGWRP